MGSGFDSNDSLTHTRPGERVSGEGDWLVGECRSYLGMTANRRMANW